MGGVFSDSVLDASVMGEVTYFCKYRRWGGCNGRHRLVSAASGATLSAVQDWVRLSASL